MYAENQKNALEVSLSRTSASVIQIKPNTESPKITQMFRTWLRLLLNKKKSVLISTSRPSPYKHNYSERNETKSNIKMFTDYIIVLIEQNELFDANEFRRFLARYESVPAE